jgi:NADP-dependent 3-hydroxy acid dehydrogenase YdfG
VHNASGRLDAVIHCAGVYLDESTVYKDVADALRHSVNTNLYGTFNLLSACLPVMLNQGYGQFIYIGSTWATTTKPSRGGATYKASKAATQSLIATLSATYSDTGVELQTFFPPKMATKMTHFKGACTEGVAIDVLHLTLQFFANRRVV